MPGIRHKQARRRYRCQTKFCNKCKKCPVCLRGHSFFSAHPRPHHFNVGNECAQGGQTLNKKLKDLKNLSKDLKSPGTFYIRCEVLSDTGACSWHACGRTLAFCCQLGSTVPKTELLANTPGKTADSFGTNFIWLKPGKYFFC